MWNGRSRKPLIRATRLERYRSPGRPNRHAESFAERYRHEREQAHEGITFDRMKRLHPRARDADIKAAIKAAVKLDDDCNKYFDRNYTDFFKAIDDALEKATRDNPGFLETTYRRPVRPANSARGMLTMCGERARS
jgi:hypothetical protein